MPDIKKISMKNFMFLTISILMGYSAFSQREIDALNRELVLLQKSGVDTISIFGKRCIECDKDYKSKFYFLYDSSSTTYAKMVCIFNDSYTSKKIYDSIFVCKKCHLITDFLRSNISPIMDEIDSSSYLMAEKTKSGNKILFSLSSDIGPSYHTSVYVKGTWNTSDLSINANVNSAFKSANYYWVFFNLLKNQWSDL